jgi:hypothetical protein
MDWRTILEGDIKQKGCESVEWIVRVQLRGVGEGKWNLGYMKGGKFVDQLIKCQIFKKDLALWSWFWWVATLNIEVTFIDLLLFCYRTCKCTQEDSTGMGKFKLMQMFVLRVCTSITVFACPNATGFANEAVYTRLEWRISLQNRDFCWHRN